MPASERTPAYQPQGLLSLLEDHSLAQLIVDIQERIRAEPIVAAHRWLLSQLLCLTGEYARARSQLKVLFRTSPDFAPRAQATLTLLDAEEVRARVFAGASSPQFVGDPATWVLRLVEALALGAAGETAAADDCREAAFGLARNSPGIGSLGPFCWLADADSRLGPVCEFFLDGQYHWFAFEQIRSFVVAPPADVLDLIWSPSSLLLRDGRALRGFMPARYPGSELGEDAIRLGWRTDWYEKGKTCVQGLGRKMWMSEIGEWALHDLRECRFDDDTALTKEA